MNSNDIYEYFTALDLKRNEKPVNQDLLGQLPDTKFNHKNNQEGEQKAEENSKCLVCMEEYQDGETLKTLPCFHKYHKECIEGWFKHQNFCPFCRNVVE
jgi:hypothetical protein